MNNVNDFQDFRLTNGSSQGKKLALTVLFVPNSLDNANTFGVELQGILGGLEVWPGHILKVWPLQI